MMFVPFGPGGPTPIVVTLASVTILFAACVAARAAVVAAWNWGHLSGLWRAAAVLPWAVASAEALAVIHGLV